MQNLWALKKEEKVSRFRSQGSHQLEYDVTTIKRLDSLFLNKQT